ncbi:MAG TPA: gephyrin-like molybdotransferase Glp [Polyangiaceae bacterium]|jgi:molybdopterin molybdotransferase|nr:gephyrin-like molybdotransferase Glp [Polyangiaceae bacterium]
MLSFDDARAQLLALAQETRRNASERVALGEAAGRVLAADLVARHPLPGFDYSAMDGYALAMADVAGAGPWTLPVAGESAAGRGLDALAAGSACRIFTGAPVPSNADAVVMQEHVRRAADAIIFEARPKPGQNIRRRGEDLIAGAVALAKGTRLTPGAIALAAMLDRAEVLVARRPRVTILCTGEELRAPGDDPRPGSVPESNSAPIAALARQAGASVRVAPIAGDDLDATRRAIEDALDATDVLVTIGGVSVGDHDVVRPALERAGVTLDFWKVSIKPGKPLAIGRLAPAGPEGRAPARAVVIGLPGNPASAIVTFAVFGMPVLRALQGDARPLPTALPVRFESTRARSSDRLELVRARLAVEGGALVARPHDNQASGATTSLASSDGLAFVPPGEGRTPATMVDFVRWIDA